jgi:hypothetical protein
VSRRLLLFSSSFLSLFSFQKEQSSC